MPFTVSSSNVVTKRVATELRSIVPSMLDLAIKTSNGIHVELGHGNKRFPFWMAEDHHAKPEHAKNPSYSALLKFLSGWCGPDLPELLLSFLDGATILKLSNTSHQMGGVVSKYVETVFCNMDFAPHFKYGPFTWLPKTVKSFISLNSLVTVENVKWFDGVKILETNEFIGHRTLSNVPPSCEHLAVGAITSEDEFVFRFPPSLRSLHVDHTCIKLAFGCVFNNYLEYLPQSLEILSVGSFSCQVADNQLHRISLPNLRLVHVPAAHKTKLDRTVNLDALFRSSSSTARMDVLEKQK